MGAPIAVVAAVTSTRTGRRLIGLLAGALACVAVAMFAPVIVLPLAIAAQSSSTTPNESGNGAPIVVGEWGYPYAGSHTTGRGYGWHPVEGCAYCPAVHFGYDMSQSCGADIFAAGPGTVTLTGRFGQFGNSVMIDHGAGTVTLYAHLADGSISVANGQTVTAGTRVGGEGQTGLSYGCHLHFEVRQNGARIDPAPFMASLGLPLI